MKETEISFCGELVVMSPMRALYWPRRSTLILSDVHLGKSAHFRRNGIAVPNLISERDIARLRNLVAYYQPLELLVVGDLVHAGDNSDSRAFTAWRKTVPDLRITLVKGNHDRLRKEVLIDWGIDQVVEEAHVAPFCFSHDGQTQQPSGVISGHLHPGVVLELPIKKRVKFPCFVMTDNALILPAFSEFTGLDTVNHPQHAKYFAIVEDQILEV